MASDQADTSDNLPDFEDLSDEFTDFGEDDSNMVAMKDEKELKSTTDSYVAIHASGFRDFLLKPELLRAAVDCGFEHPSEVQYACIPQAILGRDILCQARSGMGKTAVFILACLQQLDSSEQAVKCLVMCRTRDLASAIKGEFNRFSRFFDSVKVEQVCGGVPIERDHELLTKDCPHILIGTPGRVLKLCHEKLLNLDKLSHFVLDECDTCLENLDMRKDIQQVFSWTSKAKQVMMFSASMTEDIRNLCKKFMQEPYEMIADKESKLSLDGLCQYYVKLSELEKNCKLCKLLDSLDFEQVVVFVKSQQRAIALNKILVEESFPSMAFHAGLNQEERAARRKEFKDFQKRILITTDDFGRGMDIERVNVVINYDMALDSDAYLNRIGRACRLGSNTRGVAVSFVASDEDKEVLTHVHQRYKVDLAQMEDTISVTSCLNG